MATLEHARSQLATLVGFDTTSSRSNLDLIAYIEERLTRVGARTWRTPNAAGDKTNLVGVIGPEAPGAIVLSGHTDVVPVDGQPWTSDPWTLTERDGRLHGRGACDMKGFIACALAQAEDFAAADLARPVVYALSYDEEVGCLGAPAMIETLTRQMPPIACAIVGEPTQMKVVSAHKGIRSFRVTVTGREAHSSQTGQGVSAVMAAARLMNTLLDQADALRDAARPDSPFDPAHATLTIGMVNGGTASNILARECQFVWELRATPDIDPDEVEGRFRATANALQDAMRACAPECAVTVERMSNVPGLKPEPGGAAETLARRLTGDNAPRAVAYAAEAGQFQEGGVSTVICGPGSITQAHQADEFISIDQLAKGAAFMDALQNELCHA